MADRDPMIGRVLHGTIEIRRKIGAGGMGNVYEGYQEHLGRSVAVKVMTPEHARNPIAAEYFLREAQSASQLRHPNIIQIIDFGQEDDATIFIAMEFIPGRPLTKLIGKEFPLSRERTAEILDQTLAALTEAHNKQIVHRDLKPDNLMVEEIDGGDFVKVLDFGIAQSKAPERKAGPLTQQGAVVGTPQYMSPEQATGDSVDARSDLFSLGTILYEMLTQKSPFSGKNLPEILISVVRRHPQPPSALRPDLNIDPALEAICLRAMKKDRQLRYQSADEFRQAVKRVGSAQPTSAEAAPAQFIFKRPSTAKKKAIARRGADSSEGSPAGSQERSGGVRAEGQLFQETSVAWENSEAEAKLDVEELRGDLLGERALVTALVLHQRSHRRIDAEEMAELRERLDETLDEVVSEWGARLHSRQGSFVTFLFGVPTPRPDDSYRAVQAALSLRRTLSNLAPDETVFGFAVAHGEVYCPSQDLTRAAGEPLDLATEGAQVAGDENVVALGAELQTRLETMFRLASADSAGHRAVLGVLDVDKVRIDAEQRAGTELIGRDSEIAMLLGAFGRLSQSRGSALAVVGEPGVGKSAVVNEALRLAEQRGVRIATTRWRGEGTDAVRTARLQWLLDIVRQQGHMPVDSGAAFQELGLEREYARLLAAFVNDRLEEAFGFAGRHAREADGEARAERALQVAMRRLVRVMTNRAPLVCVVDDISGFQGSVVDFVGRWADAAGQMSILFVFGVRLRAGEAAERLPESVETLHLHPLDEPSSLAFLKVRLPSTVRANLLSRLAKIGAGFPVHLEHLAQFVKSKGDFDPAEAEEFLAASRDIADLLRLRLYEQPKSAQNVLALLAALGDGAAGDVVLDLSSSEWEPATALQKLHDEGLIEVAGERDSPRLHFRPPALRRVIYDRLSRKMRARIHQRAASYFEDRLRADREHNERSDLVALARHRAHGGDPRGALQVLRALADRSFREFDYDSGREFLHDAIDLLAEVDADSRDGAERARLELQLVRAAAATGRADEALDRCRDLDRRDDLPAALAVEVRLALARLWLDEEDPELVGRIVRQSLTEIRKLQNARPDDLELRCLLVHALQLAAHVNELQGRLVQASEHAIEAASITERGGIDMRNNPWGPSLVWETLNQLGRIRIRLGELAGARKMFDLAMRVVSEAGDRRGEVAVRANMSALLEAEGSYDSAYQNITAALREARKLGDPFMVAKLEYNRGMLLLRQKRLELAEQAFSDSLSLAEDLDWREGIAMNVDRLDRLCASAQESGSEDRGPEDRFLRPDTSER